MGGDALPDPLRSALLALSTWLAAEDVPNALIGGLAVSLLARPRTTRDIDVLVLTGESRLEELLGSCAAHGIVPRVTDALPFARRSRVLLLRHEPTGIPIDLVLGSLDLERQAVRRATKMPVGGFDFPVASAGDLIVMKAVANRPVDAADIAALLDSDADLDVDAIRSTIGEFSRLLEQPELLADFEVALRRRSRHRP